MTEKSADSKTANNSPKKKGQFVKGDPRINRLGKPRSFDKLRELAQAIGDEPAVDEKGKPVLIGGRVVTKVEQILREMCVNNPEHFVEIGYGKVPTPVDVTSGGERLSRIEFVVTHEKSSDNYDGQGQAEGDAALSPRTVAGA